MGKTANINIRIDPETKAKAEKLFAGFGITVTDAINIFLHKSIMEGGLPFEMKHTSYDAKAESSTQAINQDTPPGLTGKFKNLLKSGGMNMNAKEFDLLAQKHIIHSALAIGDDGKIISPYGTRTYGFPTVCRFYQDHLAFTGYPSQELLLVIPYHDIKEVVFSVCSRVEGGSYVVVHPAFYGRLMIERNDSRKYVVEFYLLNTLGEIENLLKAQHVKTTDDIGIVAAASNYDEEGLYKFIAENIDEWSAHLQINHPQSDDLIHEC